MSPLSASLRCPFLTYHLLNFALYSRHSANAYRRTDPDNAQLQPNQAKPAREPLSSSCNHYLSGVDDQAVTQTLEHQHSTQSQEISNSDQLQALRRQSVFVVACLHNSEDILSQWTFELIRLILALRPEGCKDCSDVFVSIYESGSSNNTVAALLSLEDDLKFMGIPCKIVTHGILRGDRERIDYLADIRNRAMEPLHEATENYDRVLWLNDIMFCTDGVLQMLSHSLPEQNGGLGADAVCGMDYDLPDPSRGCGFYDIWIAHDEAGNRFHKYSPVLHGGKGLSKLEKGKPFQVFSCWNGMLVFKADIFKNEKLAFRSHREKLGECAAGEAELIFRDMWSIGRNKVAVSPLAASAYNERDFNKCAKLQQPTEFDKSVVSWQPAPEEVECCPYARWSECFKEQNWTRFDKDVPRARSISSASVPLAKPISSPISHEAIFHGRLTPWCFFGFGCALSLLCCLACARARHNAQQAAGEKHCGV